MGVVLLVRHGQASFGADDYDVLSETGVEQSRVLGRALAAQGLAPTAVVHGAMRRQRDTATSMVDGAGWSVTPELDEGWNEFDHLGVVARSSPGDTEPERPRVPSSGRSRRRPLGGAAASTTRSTPSPGRCS